MPDVWSDGEREQSQGTVLKMYESQAWLQWCLRQSRLSDSDSHCLRFDRYTHTAPGNANGRGMKGPGVLLPADEPLLHRELKISVSGSAVSCISSSLAVRDVSRCSQGCLQIREKGYNKIALFLVTMEKG